MLYIGGTRMKIIIDKCMLFLLLSVLGMLCEFSDNFIVAMIVAIIVNSLIYVWGNQKIRTVLALAYMVFCIFNPIFTVYIPLLFYDLLYQQSFYLCVVGVIALYNFIISYSMIYSIFLLAILLVCVVLSNRTKMINLLQEEFKRLRDDSTERELLLQSQNKALLETQEYEIHYAKLKERNRIAREIHDNVGHMLSRSILQVGALLAINKDKEVDGLLEDLKKTLSEAMNSIRNSVHNLHDEAIELESTVNELIEGMQQYDIEFTYSMPKNIHQGVKYCFITTVKEALSNIVKHSNATKVIIFMIETDSHYQLNIKDNGTIDKKTESQSTHGMGLENMKERAKSLGGVFRTYQNDGFQIYLSIPKRKAD